MIVAEGLHYAVIVLVVAINALGVSIGQGIASSAALKALNIQPSAKDEITKISLIGIALIETTAILGFLIGIILLKTSPTQPSLYLGIAQLGIVAALSLPGFVVGIASAYPICSACISVVRQPFFSEKILRFMLITQSLLQTPIIFGFIIAMFINHQAVPTITIIQALKLLSTGLCIGLGSIGPSMGMAYFARVACLGIGINRNAYGKLSAFTLISQAMIETPILFSLIISIVLINTHTVGNDPIITGVALLSAALAVGLGNLGPGIGSGKIAASSCREIANNPNNYSMLLRTSILGQAFIDTCALYSFLIAIILTIWI